MIWAAEISDLIPRKRKKRGRKGVPAVVPISAPVHKPT